MQDRKGEGEEGMEGKIKWKLSEVDTRTVSRRQNELIDKFKMVVSDVINIMEQVMVYTHILIGIYNFVLSALPFHVV